MNILLKYSKLYNISLGGYVGLFIGYTVAQLPSHLMSFIDWQRKMFQKLKKSVKPTSEE